MTNLAKNIRYLRKKKNMTQPELAVIVNRKNFTTIQKWESGVSEPPLSAVNKMAETFNVDIDDFVYTDIEESESHPAEQRRFRRIADCTKTLTDAEVEIIRQIAYLADDTRDSILHQINYEYEKERKKRETVSA